MRSLKINGFLISDLSEGAYFTGIMGILISPFHVVTHILWPQQVGLAAQIHKRDLKSVLLCLDLVQENLDVIEDQTILDQARQINVSLMEFMEASDALANWERKNVSSTQRKKHKSLITDVGSFDISPWFSDHDYQFRLMRTTKSASKYLQSIEELIAYIEPDIMKLSSKTLSDQIVYVKRQLPEQKLILEVGFKEYARRQVPS